MDLLNVKDIFWKLFNASTEDDVDQVFSRYPLILNNPNYWIPLDNNQSNFGIIENQQSSPIAALIEK